MRTGHSAQGSVVAAQVVAQGLGHLAHLLDKVALALLPAVIYKMASGKARRSGAWLGEGGSRKQKTATQTKAASRSDHKEGGWVYTDPEPGAKMEIPVRRLRCTMVRRSLQPAVLGGLVLFLLVKPARPDPLFNFGPLSSPIISATFNANLAEFSGDRTVFGTEVNFIRLTAAGSPSLDLSDAFFGTAAFPATPLINMGPAQTGVVSAAIPPSFFPALDSGIIGYNILFTDTSDGLFALDSISLVIHTSSSTITSVIGPNDGFGLGVPSGGSLPAPLPISLPFGATGTGFNESITSKALTATVPEPSARSDCWEWALAAIGLLAARRMPLGWGMCVPRGRRVPADEHTEQELRPSSERPPQRG